MDINKMIARVKAILLTPKTEWPVIAAEPATVPDLYKNWIAILAAIPPVAGFIKGSIIGTSFLGVTYRAGMGAGITGAVLTVGHHRQGQALPAAIDVEPQRLARTGRDDLLHFLEVVDLPAINGNDHVAGLEPGARCRLVRNNFQNLRRHDAAPIARPEGRAGPAEGARDSAR